MQVIVTPEDTTEHKPHPAPVLKALELLGEQPDHTVMVGDSTGSGLCPGGGNVYGCVGWSVAPRKLLLAEKPDFVLHRMTDLIDICLPSGKAARA